MPRAENRKAKLAADAAPDPTPLSLAALICLAGSSALWALFQWMELLLARAGGESFCAFGDGLSCEQLWDSSAASAVQAWTGLPVAAWGLVWSLVAFACPLWSLVRRSRGLSPGGPWSAALITGVAGGLGALGLLAISLLYHLVCSTCAGSYLLAGAYMVICLVQTPLRSVQLTRGVSLAAGGVGVAYALLLYPGLHTPPSAIAQGRALLDQMAREQAKSGARETGDTAPSRAGAEATPEDRQRRDQQLASMIESLSPELKQGLADALALYKQSSALLMRPARALIGPPDAPVRITEFIDSLCGHCAAIHDGMRQLKQLLPLRTFAVESRHFPLDPSCNPSLSGESDAPVRCFAAKAQICLEGQPDAFDFTTSLFVNQHDLDPGRVLELAEPLIPRQELQDCIASPITAARLADDIEWALEHEIEGTPMILLNGRKVSTFGPLLYALLLTRGESANPAFDALPAPN
jgi:protein-disulfide isomerase